MIFWLRPPLSGKNNARGKLTIERAPLERLSPCIDLGIWDVAKVRCFLIMWRPPVSSLAEAWKGAQPERAGCKGRYLAGRAELMQLSIPHMCTHLVLRFGPLTIDCV
jgi:hypothetical protein